jgi:hypothetical protein
MRELRAAFVYVLILLAFAQKEDRRNITTPPRGCPPLFFRKSLILIRLLSVFVQEFDSKLVAIFPRGVAEPAVRSEASPGGIIRARTAGASRRTEHSQEWPCHLRGTRCPYEQSAGGQISSMFYFKARVNRRALKNRFREIPRLRIVAPDDFISRRKLIL